MTSRVQFKKATQKDSPSLLRLMKAYYTFEHLPFPHRIEGPLKTLLNDDSFGVAWLLRIGKQSVGYMIMTYVFDLGVGGKEAGLTDLYITPTYRRQSLGTRALEFVSAYCRRKGLKALDLQVENRNQVALAFYLKFGFKRLTRIPMSMPL